MVSTRSRDSSKKQEAPPKAETKKRNVTKSAAKSTTKAQAKHDDHAEDEQVSIMGGCYSFLCRDSASHPHGSCYSYDHVHQTASTPSSEPAKDLKRKEPVDDASAAAQPAKKGKLQKLQIGDSIPSEFPVLYTQEHAEFNLFEASKESGLVLFFYPRANTPGCTNQACAYRDNFDKFTEKGFKVYGVSADKEGSLANWKKKQNYQYDFISDTEKQVIGLFGVGKGGPGAGITRSHVVIAKGGKLVHTKIPTPAKESWSDALEAIENL